MTLVSGDITRAVQFLEQEDVVAIPTETVYGLAGNIFSEKAIKKIFALKQRPFFNPLIVHLSGAEQLPKVVEAVPDRAKLLAEKFWPGPLTLILKKRPEIPDLVTSGKDTVAVRVPNHPVSLELLEKLDFPLAAPSANPFGSISPTESSHVASYFEGKLSMVLEGGPCERGIESTIIGFEDGNPVLYRLGSITVEDISNLIGEIQVKNKKEAAPDAPGMLSRHYAPQTTTYVVDDVAKFIMAFPEKRVGVLLFQNAVEASNIKAQQVLSRQGNLEEAASKLYAALHKLDKQELDMIVAEQFPDQGMGKAINDRLQRATKK
ncbi:L-threonylcarbamoyladenylate synthase [Lentiprolixibacter aurantiacus]|uniref:Threonylcarbamoyl-AMP synthase n=1 Tax=Lentiprolixibacter aurantiacus TaxID=2993939 RepID=A0AAE3SNL3_9FLAO|nr:L-threonylcarbamoyladenylate synthase [Lentiprolixibacter aurantiacus]MCX2718592.1 L-threonylcarbamoyladenylate synthase [Lentiprolixibacter aurantiacus]